MQNNQKILNLKNCWLSNRLNQVDIFIILMLRKRIFLAQQETREEKK
jgi:hypothetical protein